MAPIGIPLSIIIKTIKFEVKFATKWRHETLFRVVYFRFDGIHMWIEPEAFIDRVQLYESSKPDLFFDFN